MPRCIYVRATERRARHGFGGAGHSRFSMKHQHDDFTRTQVRAVRTKIGEALRERYDLMETTPKGLVELLRELEIRESACETREARLYAEFDACVTEMVRAANR
jgi:hypothetical protein